jgi:hypothetical protein
VTGEAAASHVGKRSLKPSRTSTVSTAARDTGGGMRRLASGSALSATCGCRNCVRGQCCVERKRDDSSARSRATRRAKRSGPSIAVERTAHFGLRLRPDPAAPAQCNTSASWDLDRDEAVLAGTGHRVPRGVRSVTRSAFSPRLRRWGSGASMRFADSSARSGLKSSGCFYSAALKRG